MTTPTLTPEQRSAELARIRAGMIGNEYFVMHRQSSAPQLKAAAALEHFQWLVRMEKEGRILLTGGIFQRDGTQSEGLTILRAGNWEAAEAIAGSDPFVVVGAVTYRIERFRLGAGRIAVSVSFSDQSVGFS